MELKFVNAKSPDFAMLAQKLDDYYFEVVGAVQNKYAECNKPHNFACLAVVYDDGQPVGCGCWKAIDPVTAELKRMYVLPEYRRKGVASMIVKAMEDHATATGCHKMILETARTTPESAAFYLALGYTEIENYDSPAGAEYSRCFDKVLSDGTMR